jgi:hypothetical protein
MMHEFKYFTAMVILSKDVNVDCVNEQPALESVVHAFFPIALAILVTHLCSKRNALLRLVLVCVFHSPLSLAVSGVRNYFS